MQQSTPAAYYRGGTSRGVMFQEKHLPKDASLRRSIFLQVMGTPDPNGRQLDGMGAGISSLSKICVIAPTDDPNADVTYTFVGLGIETPVVDLAGNCGNMSSAVGPYAFNERLLGDIDYAKEGTSIVRIFNTNTQKYIRNSFPVANGQAQAQGDFAIDGVGGTGARVTLDFLDPSGSKTGKLLPTGNVIDKFNGIEVSCVDAAGPGVFVSADDIGVDGTILPNDFNKFPEKLKLLEDIRRQAAVAMGMAKSVPEVPRVTPKIALVSPSATHKILSGQTQHASAVDIVIRFLSDEQPHRAIPLTGALCVAAAAKVNGSVVQRHVAQKLVDPGMVTIGHSSGRIQVTAAMNDRGEVETASVFRTARRIMDGQVYWNK
ncbi:PrpF protein [Macrophomina phaseolina MS6]|uniref:PrpF protein n=1 Tax=Macrophomina phaseolina (strain MS6) TaxID=1126212 RepID=K2RTP0_MACPH|nr:PrpF protein [Macrophomina phaseolina MS6]